MTSYLDFGFSKFLEKPLFSGKSSGLKTRSQYASGAFSNQLVGANAIDNEKTQFNFRAYKAVVDVTGNGDFKNIQDAIEAVNIQGSGNIFIKEGTYQLSSDLILYDKIRLIGEGIDRTILDFQNSSYRVICNGIDNFSISDLNIEKSSSGNGAIDIDDSSYFTLENLKFDLNSVDISMVGSCNVIRVENIFGSNGETFLKGDFSTDSVRIFRNIYFNTYSENLVDGGIVNLGMRNITFNTVFSTNLSKSLLNGTFRYFRMSDSFIDQVTLNSLNLINLTGGAYNDFVNTYFKGNTSSDLINLATSNQRFSNCRFINSGGGDVIDISGNFCGIVNCELDGNGSATNIIDISGDQNNIAACKISQGGIGVNVQASGNNNNISANAILTTTKVQDAGTSTVIDGTNS